MIKIKKKSKRKFEQKIKKKTERRALFLLISLLILLNFFKPLKRYISHETRDFLFFIFQKFLI